MISNNLKKWGTCGDDGPWMRTRGGIWVEAGWRTLRWGGAASCPRHSLASWPPAGWMVRAWQGARPPPPHWQPRPAVWRTGPGWPSARRGRPGRPPCRGPRGWLLASFLGQRVRYTLHYGYTAGYNDFDFLWQNGASQAPSQEIDVKLDSKTLL